MKCSCCGTSVAIIKCKECSSNMCYNCDERVHIKFERHQRITLSFQETIQTSLLSSRIYTIQSQSYYQTQADDDLSYKIQQKKDNLKILQGKQDQINRQTQNLAQEMKLKYENQLREYEIKLNETSQQLDNLQNDLENNLDVDKIQEEFSKLEQEAKAEIERNEKEGKIYEEKSQKAQILTDKVNQTSVLQQDQLKKMDEILTIFKQCSEQMQKEKELLLLENQKLVAEVQIFSKFFDDNEEIMNKLCQGVIPEEQDENDQN
ncbi:hypothetical protein pb186bvf_018094 [Paramecium bursaria]